MTKSLIAAAAAAFVGVSACAQTPDAEISTQSTSASADYTLPDSVVFSITGAANGQNYDLYVRTPMGYADNDASYPVVYLLDAGYLFPIAATQAGFSEFVRQLPPAIYVGVDYPDRSIGGLMAARTRDYTPINFPAHAPTEQLGPLTGGGPAFLEALEQDIIPAIESRYRVSDDRSLVGYSYGGLFGAYAMLEQPDLFDRLLLISPSVWYGEGWLFQHLAATADRGNEQPTRLSLFVGSEEEEPLKMVSSMQGFASMLQARGDANLSIDATVLDDETHFTIAPRALTQGLLGLFAESE